MILKINTSDMKVVEIALNNGDQVVDSMSEENEYGSQVLLPLIEKLLEVSKLEPKDLKGIEVTTGPGSFTGLRVGVSVANALGYSLGIPVNGKKIESEINY